MILGCGKPYGNKKRSILVLLNRTVFLIYDHIAKNKKRQKKQEESHECLCKKDSVSLSFFLMQ